MDDVLATERALVEKPVSPPAETGQKIEPPPAEAPVLTKEQIEQMITEATAKAVVQAKELGKRELQSQQDRNRAELARAQRQAKITQGQLDAARTHLRSLDPETAKEFELAELRAERAGRATVEQEEELARQQTEFHERFHTNLNQFITNIGVDPKDTRIDWATDAKDYLDAQQRILTSAAKIQQEKIQATQGNLEKRLKEVEAKIKAEEVEANSVETSTSLGAGAGSDREFVKNFAEGKIPMTKENVNRYNKIVESE